MMANPNVPRRANNFANRGKGLETLIDYTNRQYLAQNVADVRKVPTPVLILKVKPNGDIIGRKQRGEWVDYIGVGDGRALCFEAKETSTKSFPLNKLPDHQYELMKSWYEKGACCFVLVAFTNKFEEIYLLPFTGLHKFWTEAAAGERKSIPYSYFLENCEQVKSNRGFTLDYLAALRKKG